MKTWQKLIFILALIVFVGVSVTISLISISRPPYAFDVKTEGVGTILRHFSLPQDAAAVVGDDYNDLGMILTYQGWAVDSGKPDVVRNAPHVCRSVGTLIRTLMEA